MVQGNLEALRLRAAELADKSPSARQVLEFYVNAVSSEPFGIGADGPEPLAKAAALLDPAIVEFFARTAIRRRQYASPINPASARCPQCASLPQLGVLRPEGHGAALSLSCSMCLTEWRHKRDSCPSCGGTKSLTYYQADQFPHMQVQACDECRTYLHLIDLGKDPSAIPELDELAALPLDVWAQEQGYRKIQVNLAGI